MDSEIVVSDAWVPVWPAPGAFRSSAPSTTGAVLPEITDAEAAGVAIEELVSRAYTQIDETVTDERVATNVLGVADEVLEQRAFHEMRRTVSARVRPIDVIRFAHGGGPPDWLVEAVGPSNVATLRVGDRRIRQIVAASFEQFAWLIDAAGERGAGGIQILEPARELIASRARVDPLWYMSERSLPWQVRMAMLARDRADVLSVAVISCARFEMSDRTKTAVLDAWVASATQYLAFLTSLPGVNPREGVTPIDVSAVAAEHVAASAEIARAAGARRSRRAQN